MKKYFSILTVVAILATLLVTVTPVSAATLFDDDFDAYEAKAYTNVNQGLTKWDYVRNNATAKGTTAVVDKGEGDKYLYLTLPAGAEPQHFIEKHNLDITVADKLTIEGDFLAPAQGTQGQSDIRLLLDHTSTGQNTFLSVFRFDAGTIKASNTKGTYGVLVNEGEFRPETWYHVKVELTIRPAQAFTITVTDDTGKVFPAYTREVPTDWLDFSVFTGAAIRPFLYNQNNTTLQTLGIDNLVLSTPDKLTFASSVADGAFGVPLQGEITLTANNELDPASVTTDAVSLSDGTVEDVSLGADGKTVTVSYAGLAGETDYTLDISGIKDISGQSVAEPITFRTDADAKRFYIDDDFSGYPAGAEIPTGGENDKWNYKRPGAGLTTNVSSDGYGTLSVTTNTNHYLQLNKVDFSEDTTYIRSKIRFGANFMETNSSRMDFTVKKQDAVAGQADITLYRFREGDFYLNGTVVLTDVIQSEVWYDVLVMVDATSSTVSAVVTNTETGEKWVTDSRPVTVDAYTANNIMFNLYCSSSEDVKSFDLDDVQIYKPMAALALLSSEPANNAMDVAVNAPIVLQFSNDIQDASAMTLNDVALPAEEIVVSGNTVTITPAQPLAYQTQYTLALAGVTDVFGQTLDAQSITFTTQSAVAVTTLRVKDAANNDITEGKLTAGAITAEVVLIDNNPPESKGAVVILALYDGNRLAKLALSDTPTGTGPDGDTYTATLTVDALDSGEYTARLMVWSDFERMLPIAATDYITE